MEAPPEPDDEDERLRALRSCRILDTSSEQVYDDLTSLAAQICGTEMALLTLVDEERQWFKSRLNFPEKQTPREHSFCAHAITQPELDVMVVRDAREDARFEDNPLVVGDPGIRFYAGAPVVLSQGHALGTICVLDREPRHLDDDQLAALQALARQAATWIEARRVADTFEDLWDDLDASGEDGSRIDDLPEDLQDRLGRIHAQMGDLRERMASGRTQ